MKAQVDPDRCQGHTLCAMRAPSVFVLSEEDGHATAIDGVIDPSLEAQVLDAASSCPEQAILIEN
jgi:ferredoxin